MAMMCIRNLAGSVGIATLAVLSLGVIAQAGTPLSGGIPLEKLKSAYLQCEHMAVKGKLGTGEIMLCSVLYEELKQRAFGGDFPRLKAWADEQLRPARAEQREKQ
jgi:hypothetical protein